VSSLHHSSAMHWWCFSNPSSQTIVQPTHYILSFNIFSDVCILLLTWTSILLSALPSSSSQELHYYWGLTFWADLHYGVYTHSSPIGSTLGICPKACACFPYPDREVRSSCLELCASCFLLVTYIWTYLHVSPSL
jgi:hypothetical protein